MHGDDGRPTGLMGVVRDITERKRAEAALAESERRLRDLAANLPGAIFQFVRDRDGHYATTFVSDGAVDLLGSPVEVLLNPARLFENVHPDDVPDMWASIRASEDSLSRWRHEFRILFPTGETRWVQGTSNPTPREDGSIVWNGILFDITDRKRAEAGIAERERRYNLLLENVPGFVYRCRNDRDWTMEYLSDGCRAVTGYAPEDFIENRTLAYNDVILPEWRERVWELWQTSLAERRPCELEYPIRTAGGEVRWVWERGRGVFDDGGQLLFLEGYIEDITARKDAEMAMRQSEEKYRTLFEQSSQGIYLHDFDGRILDVNEMACRQSGYTRDELLQMTVFDLHPTWSDAVFMPREEILRAWREWPPDHRTRLEAAHRHKDGTVYPVEVSTGVIRYGERHLILAIVQDISARKQAEEEREKLRAQLSQVQKMESVGRLAGGVAHDFNNMLTAILGYTELALHSVEPTSPLRHYLEEIRTAGRRSADLTRQLLAFARRQPISPQVLDLNQTVEGMLKLLGRLIGEDIELVWRPGGGLWPVRVDPSQVDQVLANLCVNARDAIGGVGRITIETANVSLDTAWCAGRPDRRPGDYVMLAVSDTGCGMDEATLAMVFEPFFTTKEVGQGTGLGLATVYGIVTQNHGCIDVVSAPGQGTTFRIYLPRHVGAADQPADQPAVEPARRGRETILLVEDEPTIVELGRAMLEHLGYAVLIARTPGEALRLARQYSGDIHLLMTDVIMPEMNGRDLAREIEAVRPGLKCLYMSGYAADVIAAHAPSEPATTFLQKPFTLNQLATRLREALAR
jgi:two-component system cell cycle sensor histidine kinase/response regulator CckA